MSESAARTLDRELAWQSLNEAAEEPGDAFDVLVAGGGVTGAAVLHEAARRGLRAALVERGDFASGTSSRSSKLVHGGLRYLKEGKIALTRESVHERQELLRDAPGLVEPIGFLMPHYRGRKPSRTTLAIGLTLYDALAGAQTHRFVDAHETLDLAPPLNPAGLEGAHAYTDATTDDARLVLELVHEAVNNGAVALNYASATPLLDGGRVCGARIEDAAGDNHCEIRARVTIAATGVFADELRAKIGGAARIRPLRGSHLIVDDARLPLAQAVAFEHPADGRPVFAYPWLGRTLVGTTDLDHGEELNREPSISPDEVTYLLEALRAMFPSAGIDTRDVIATYAGVRPVVASAQGDPSRASRDHVVWDEKGLITIAGGKLTTFRPMAMDALAAAAPRLPAFDRTPKPAFERPPAFPAEPASPDESERIGTTPFTWARLRWCARNESVVHLDDLLLRRTRIGLLTRDGGERFFERVRAICAAELKWNDARWIAELAAYRERIRTNYGVPAG